MKKGIHPEYKTINVKLADGTETVIRSTMENDDYRSDVDRTNHPFYTGRRQYVDTAGRVEKFNRRYARKSADAETGESAPAGDDKSTADKKPAGKKG